jgi:hypothetical protein
MTRRKWGTICKGCVVFTYNENQEAGPNLTSGI